MSERATVAALLAGGLATRLRPITETIPKSLVEVNGEPFVIHQLRMLRRQGVERVVLCIGHLGEQVEALVGDGREHGVRVDYSYDGDAPLGTAGALRRALPLLGDHFLVLYGDSYLACDYQAVWRAYVASGRLGLMTVYRNEGRWDTSNVEFDGERIVAYDKRERTPRMEYIDYGLGVLAARALALVEPGVPHDLSDLYRELLARGELAAAEVHERFYEIGSFAGLEETRAFIAAQERTHVAD